MTTRDETAAPAVAIPMDMAALVAGLVTVAAWGSAFVGIRSAGHALSPGALALGRLLVSTAILGSIALVRRDPLPGRRALIAIAAYGVLWLGIYTVVLNAAERRVDAGTAAMLVNTGPILIAIFAGIFLRESFPPGLFAGCAVAFGGVALIGVATAGARAGWPPSPTWPRRSRSGWDGRSWARRRPGSRSQAAGCAWWASTWPGGAAGPGSRPSVR
jgi:drug/metabolite transporter (DMT)-like permease